MSCQSCGSPCQGDRCQMCAQIEANEARHGDSVDVDDDDDDQDEWEIHQTGLDGEDHEGQATLAGGVAKDGGEP